MSLLNPLNFPIIFSQPLRLAPSAWITHVPFGMFLVQLIEPKTLVELGSYYGVSYCSFCQAIETFGLTAECFAVDTWEGDEQSGFFNDQVYENLKQHHDPLYGSFSTLLRSTFDEALSNFKDGSIDLLHIDGYHTYEAVKHDYETWLPKMSKNGVILFHDIHVREKDFGVWKLWGELRSKYPSFEFTHGHGLGIIAVSNNYPKSLDILFQLPKDEIPLVQEFFHIQGKNVEAQYENSLIESQLTEEKKLDQEIIVQLKSQLTEEKKHNQELIGQLGAWKNKWDNLESSLAWKLMERLRKLYRLLFPFGSWQHRFIHTLLALRLLRKDVFRIVPRYVGHRLKEKFFQSTDVSIVIPVFNLLHLTQACIESIYRETKSQRFEVIVIDNGSTDSTFRWLTAEKMKRRNLKVLPQKENIGFGPAINKGVESSKGQYIVLLNNDTTVAPGWLDNLIAATKKDSSIGIVSPVTNYVGEGPQIDRNAKDLPADPAAISEYANSIAPRSDLIYEINRLVFFCVLLPRELLKRVGYLDTSFQTGNFEDDDYCFRTRLAGYRLAIASNAFVYHIGSATFKENAIPHSQLMLQNRQKFYKKVSNLSTSSFHFPPKHSHSIEVSIILRTMNRTATLHDALMSIANQTFRDFEVVIVNDGGVDIPEQLSLFKSYFPITYIRHEENKGRSAAANTGMDHTKGKWITFLDDDDIVYPWHLESLVEAAKSSGSQFIYSDFNRAIYFTQDVKEADILQTPSSWDFCIKDFQVINYIPIHCWLFSRECIKEAGIMNESLGMLEDYDFLLRLSALYTFHHLPKITCEYRYYGHNQNSVFANIDKTLTALETIYKNYPVQDPQVLLKREQMISKIQEQVEKVKEITDNTGIILSIQEANREIIRAILEV